MTDRGGAFRSEVAGIDVGAFLFESKTVLGRRAEDVVDTAWDFERLWRIHSWYCEVYRETLDRIQAGDVPPETLMETADEELSAYLSAMAENLLLPRQLWPADYLGPDVYGLHGKLAKAFGVLP
jgi:hypothetical protein